MKITNEIVIYKTNDDEIEVEVFLTNDTVWLSRKQLSTLFDRDVKTIGKHINNIFNDGELESSAVVANLATTATDGKTYQVDYYNLDVIISVGYRVKSIRGVQFRQWATKRLKDYFLKGFVLNQQMLKSKRESFLKTLHDLKILTSHTELLDSKDVISLIASFSNTWFSLDSYDRNSFPTTGTIEQIQLSSDLLISDLEKLKEELIKKGEATKLFAQEKRKGNLQGIFGNVFQSVFGQDAYSSIEEKAAHLLYFIIKNHPFNDGNKRSGAFGFIWLLHKAGIKFQDKINPETLTTLTILIAESSPSDKEKMIGIILLLLNSNLQ
jgi:death-on-curing family protein